ncbi:hypothetical protein OC835_007937, partial [Tilletia horrida]
MRDKRSGVLSGDPRNPWFRIASQVAARTQPFRQARAPFAGPSTSATGTTFGG